jgi:hypothetical protein
VLTLSAIAKALGATVDEIIVDELTGEGEQSPPTGQGGPKKPRKGRGAK